jgi:hypothetical protein
VEICTKYAQKGMFNIFLTVFFATLGFAFVEPYFFIGYLVSIAIFGLYQAIFMANAGGAWDNAKKIVEVELKEKGTPLTRRQLSATQSATIQGHVVSSAQPDHQVHDAVRASRRRARCLTREQRGPILTHVLAAIFLAISVTFRVAVRSTPCGSEVIRQMSLFARKPISELLAEEGHPNALKRALGAGDLIMLAIGAVIGAGIFSSIGTAAAGEILPTGVVVRYGAGPGTGHFFHSARPGLRAGRVVLRRAGLDDSAGRQCVRLLVRNVGEIIAWIIGWDLILEYAVGNIAWQSRGADTSRRSHSLLVSTCRLADARLSLRAF